MKYEETFYGRLTALNTTCSSQIKSIKLPMTTKAQTIRTKTGVSVLLRLSYDSSVVLRP